MYPLRGTNRGGGPKRRLRPWLVLLAVALVTLLLFGTGLVIGSALGLLPGGSGWEPLSPDPPGSPAPVAVGPPVTGPRTALTLITTYARCGCTERQNRVAGAELAGRDAAALAREFPEYTVQSFSADSAVLFRLVPGYCPDMQTFRTLGLVDGHVAVYLGRPSTGLLLARVTGIPVKDLPLIDREKLATGIVVKGDAAVEALLEGLTE